MKMDTATMAVAAVAMFAALLSTDSAHAQRSRRASPNSYGTSNPSGQRSASDPRFTAEEQRTIDAISRNGWSTGY
jgi:hypothetical protein